MLRPAPPRRIASKVVGLVREGKSVAICGPLHSGQSALLEELSDCVRGSVVLDCSSANSVETLLGIVESSSRPSAILAQGFDLVPELQKHLASRAGSTTLVLATSCLSGAKRLASSLGGDWATVETWPQSEGERSQHPDGLVETLFSPKPSLRTSSELVLSDYQAIIGPSGADRPRYFDRRISAIGDYAVKAQICDSAAVALLVELLAQQRRWLQKPVSFVKLANQTGMTPEEVERGLNVACDLMLMVRMGSADSKSGLHAMAARTPFLLDSALREQSKDLISGSTASSGYGDQLNLDSFVAGEVVKQLSWLDGFTTLQSWQGNSGRHEALLLHRGLGQRSQRTVVIRSSVSSSASPADLECFDQAHQCLGSAFWVGLLLFTGTEVMALSDRVFAAPLDSLWCSRAPQVSVV